MHCTFPLFAISVLVSSAASVNINLYGGSNACNNTSPGGRLVCGGIAAGTCCSFNPVQDVLSAGFTGMATTSVAIIANGNCQQSLNTATGATTYCLNSFNTARGALWKAPGREIRVGDPLNCEKTVEPNIATFANGRSFKINYDVPSNVTDVIVDMVMTDPQLSLPVPDEVLPYEIVN
ncbi:hypothetical protein F5Y10DRAFT_269400 [Nemania abortiva]|nr:hypothetical protein F5Y10DRAFT_269400 [Nemania abortiva]